MRQRRDRAALGQALARDSTLACPVVMPFTLLPELAVTEAGAPRSWRDAGTRLMRASVSTVLLILAGSVAAATIEEDFASDPASRGWKVHGETALFEWNPVGENLRMTWDSSKSNSFFYRPLATVLAKTDDFRFAFDLRLSDIAVGVNSNKPFTFELAIGFLNVADTSKTNFLRGVGINPATGPRNLVEFDYFPDRDFGATISPTMVSSNNQFATGFNFPLELTRCDLFHVAMTYTASNQTLATVMARQGAPFGPIKDVQLGAGFADFRVDAFAITSYSDAGADGSLLAQGVVDNIVVTVPEPPISSLSGPFMNQLWQVEFVGRTGWVYTLERTADFRSWNAVSGVTSMDGGRSLLTDANAIAGEAYYRVRAERP